MLLRISQISLAKFAFTSAGQFNKSNSYILLSKLARYSQASTGQEMKNETNSSEKEAIKRCEYCKDYDKLKEKLDELNQDNETLLDKYKRALAEIENTRKRGERLVDESKSFAIQGFCKDLIEVADILNIAVGTLEKEMATNNSLKNVYEGINMTNDSLLKTFAKHGLIKIDALGQKFDPNLHEAVFEEPAEKAKYPPGHVSHVLKTGYSLNKRTVRPTKVVVVKTK